MTDEKKDKIARIDNPGRAVGCLALLLAIAVAAFMFVWAVIVILLEALPILVAILAALWVYKHWLA